MKVRISLKTPDAVSYAVEEAYPLEAYNEELDEFITLDPDSEEACEVMDAREDFKELSEKWFSYGECVTLEIDTESQTCKVLPAND